MTELIGLTAVHKILVQKYDFKKSLNLVQIQAEDRKLPMYSAVFGNKTKYFYDPHEIAKYFGLIKDNKKDIDTSILNDDDLALHEILQDVDMPMDRIKIEKEFWSGRKVKTQYLKDVGAVIPIDEALEVIETGVINFKTKMYNIPQKLKSLYPKISKEELDRLHELIDESFDEFNKKGFNDEDEDE